MVEVGCPACGAPTMVTPGQSSFCFSCGQPVPAQLASAGQYPLTGAMPAPTPPPNPYAAVASAVLAGAAGTFAIGPGGDVLVGRDPAQCAIHLSEPRVSAVHARLKLEGGRLLVRDEASNNGVWIAGQRIAAGAWTPVPGGAALRFGPVEFAVRVES